MFYGRCPGALASRCVGTRASSWPHMWADGSFQWWEVLVFRAQIFSTLENQASARLHYGELPAPWPQVGLGGEDWRIS